MSVEKSKRQALLKEGFQTISSIVQAGYLNGDFNNITSWDIVNQKGLGSIVDYFNQRLNAAYRCNTNETTNGCGRKMPSVLFPGGRPWSDITAWNHNAVWLMPSKAMYWIQTPWQINNKGLLWNVTSDAYATDFYMAEQGLDNYPKISMVQIYCNISDTINNPFTSFGSPGGAPDVKPGMCGYVYSRPGP